MTRACRCWHPARAKRAPAIFWGLARDDSPWQGDLPPAVAYVYTEDRDRAREVLADYTGVLQVDGWGGFKRLTGKQDALQGDASPVTLAFCWSHNPELGFIRGDLLAVPTRTVTAALRSPHKSTPSERLQEGK